MGIVSFINGSVLLCIGIILNIIMAGYVGPIILDPAYDGSLIPAGVTQMASKMPDGSDNPVYAAMSGQPVTIYYVNLYYALCSGLSLLGCALMVISLLRDSSVESDSPVIKRFRGRV